MQALREALTLKETSLGAEGVDTPIIFGSCQKHGWIGCFKNALTHQAQISKLKKEGEGLKPGVEGGSGAGPHPVAAAAAECRACIAEEEQRRLDIISLTNRETQILVVPAEGRHASEQFLRQEDPGWQGPQGEWRGGLLQLLPAPCPCLRGTC